MTHLTYIEDLFVRIIDIMDQNLLGMQYHDKSAARSFYNSINELPVINWEALGAHKNTFFSLDYFKTLENSFNKKIDFTYIVFFNALETPIAFAVTQLVTINTKELSDQELPCLINDSLKNTLLKNLDVSVLICGNLFSCGEHGFVFDNNQLAPADAYKCLANALRDTRKMDNAEKPSFILVPLRYTAIPCDSPNKGAAVNPL